MSIAFRSSVQLWESYAIWSLLCFLPPLSLTLFPLSLTLFPLSLSLLLISLIRSHLFRYVWVFSARIRIVFRFFWKWTNSSFRRFCRVFLLSAVIQQPHSLFLLISHLSHLLPLLLKFLFVSMSFIATELPFLFFVPWLPLSIDTHSRLLPICQTLLSVLLRFHFFSSPLLHFSFTASQIVLLGGLFYCFCTHYFRLQLHSPHPSCPSFQKIHLHQTFLRLSLLHWVLLQSLSCESFQMCCLWF